MINLDISTILRYKEFTEWTDTLQDVQESMWLQPMTEGKASVGEVISHLKNWDAYLIETIIPAIKYGEGMIFPDFDSFNKLAYEYAKSGISKDRLLEEFKATRLQLVEMLLAAPDLVAKHVTVNGVATCPHTGTPYSLLYIIHEFNDHDNHHKNQIAANLK
ncbi:DinB family protein [Paenibacillus roseipurpureus]|uniref:DinB family protein n=1 Tax=Paenibacillus roseopurpureus TaxID=2918901 RepID=A0AA96RJ20_9BACL|nr:DinB family protein [Paenibacillus sp. MBLB1832]WNR44913.1 DinB family protein [Paenibacillus sp. MBLB1832]